MFRRPAALLVDSVAVVVFVVLGRRTHELDGVVDVVATAAPFWIGLVVAHLVIDRTVGQRGRAADSVASGPAIAALTVTVGMVVRRLAGGGTAGPFVVVAVAFLVAAFTGWRAVAMLRRRRIPQV